MLQSKILTLLSFLFSLAVVSAFPSFYPSSLWRRGTPAEPRSLPAPQAETKNSCPAIPNQRNPSTVSRVQAGNQQQDADSNSGSNSGSKTQQNPSVMQTLPPNVHWTTNTKVMANVNPIAAAKDSKMYYGSSGAQCFSDANSLKVLFTNILL